MKIAYEAHNGYELLAEEDPKYSGFISIIDAQRGLDYYNYEYFNDLKQNPIVKVISGSEILRKILIRPV